MTVARVRTGNVNTGAITTALLADDAVSKDKLGILTTKGDVLGFSTEPARVAVGADNIPLCGSAAAATGLAYVDIVGTHVGLADPHTQYQRESEKDSASGYAGLNSSSRTTKGADAVDDLIVDSATKGLVLKDSADPPHYWRVTVGLLGLLTTTDLGTTKP